MHFIYAGLGIRQDLRRGRNRLALFHRENIRNWKEALERNPTADYDSTLFLLSASPSGGGSPAAVKENGKGRSRIAGD
jgi:hypothetical protein